ncbi:MAG: hypothetical protein ACLFQM_05740 [Fidelibacterota bacterium]
MRSLKKERKKWQEWIEIIQKDLEKQLKYHEIYTHYPEKDLQQEFLEFVDECYFIQTAISVRRQIGTQKDEISLMKLLRQLHYAAAKIDITELTQEMIESDIDKLNKIEDQVGLFVDRKIAHLDRREFEQECTIKNLERALKTLYEIVTKYYELLYLKF